MPLNLILRNVKMFDSVILDVAISMVLVYLMLSLICSMATEWIARIHNTRANMLEEWIRNFLDDPNGEKFSKKFYNHPLIKGLAQKGIKPSYISSRNFAIVLFDIIAPADGEHAKTIKNIRDAVLKIENVYVKRTLLSIMDVSGNDIGKARKNVEVWFDEGMDRLSGQYRRKSQAIVLLLALIICVPLNADTFMLYDIFSSDITARDMAVVSAQDIIDQTSSNSSKPSLTIKQVQNELQQLQTPMGWSWPPTPDDPRTPSTFIGWIKKFFGLLLTVSAVSMGAPFWFDALSKLISLRSTGKAPETSKIPEKNA